jgi:hypothetical protein
MKPGGAVYLRVVLLSLLASLVLVQAPPADHNAASPGVRSEVS